MATPADGARRDPTVRPMSEAQPRAWSNGDDMPSNIRTAFMTLTLGALVVGSRDDLLRCVELLELRDQLPKAVDQAVAIESGRHTLTSVSASMSTPRRKNSGGTRCSSGVSVYGPSPTAHRRRSVRVGLFAQSGTGRFSAMR